MVKLCLPRQWPGARRWFQSPCRDSWWSNYAERANESDWRSFNPPVGILGGQTSDVVNFHRLSIRVSIPLSGFLVVKLPQCPMPPINTNCFNPPVGILGGQTKMLYERGYCVKVFQSPCRDSWWSNLAGLAASRKARVLFQSPCRDSWWSNLAYTEWQARELIRFNPPVGILGGQTSSPPPVPAWEGAVSIPLSRVGQRLR